MTPEAGLALFSVMLVLAFIPGVSVLVVSTRSATAGFLHGVAATAGILAGDIIFIIIAIAGLTFLADMLGNAFVYIKVLGGIYLVWLGIQTMRSRPISRRGNGTRTPTLSSSFLAGFWVTLGDQKAILFYLGFLPAFIDLTAISLIDMSLIVLIAIVSIGVAKLAYARFAAESSASASPGLMRGLNRVAGCTMLGVGLYLIYSA